MQEDGTGKRRRRLSSRAQQLWVVAQFLLLLGLLLAGSMDTAAHSPAAAEAWRQQEAPRAEADS